MLTTIAVIVVIAASSSVATVESTHNLPPFSCDAADPSTNSFGFCNSDSSISERVQDLISRLTLEEKISQLVNKASPIPRLGLPFYQWWSEALHGVGDPGLSGSEESAFTFDGDVKAVTSFPQVILTASSFNAELWYRIGKAIGIEARALYNEGYSEGMTFWSPNINIFRDPRWGRGQETPGEDPLINSKYGVSFVRGIQGDSFEGGSLKDGHLLASACCKHLTAYDLENWNGFNRFTFDASVTKQDMADTYQPPFKSCVEEGQVSGIMCAYNLVNGVPNCANYDLLTGIVRGEWGFQGYVTSDCNAVSHVFEKQNYADSPEDAVALVLKAGLDLDCGSYLGSHAKSAIETGKISEADLDRALYNLFTIRMRLGLLNGLPSKLPYGYLNRNDICSPENQELALEAARQGIVLLKNSENLLPLSKSGTFSLAVIGPNSNVSGTLLGTYAGPPCKTITPLEGLSGYVKRIMFHQGCDTINCTSDTNSHALKIAESADNVVLFMGLNQEHEGERIDRIDLNLPGRQEHLIKNIAEVARKPIILVLICGGPVDISFAKNDPKIGSILWAGYPGESGGQAIAEIIFGDHNPGGRLPVTWYRNDFINVPMTDMRMRAVPSSGYPGRTYRFFQGKPVYEFGYGLSYSNYTYKFISVNHNKTGPENLLNFYKNSFPIPLTNTSSESCEKARFYVRIGVKNHGRMVGKHPVLLFMRHDKPRNGSPIKQLIGFKMIRLATAEDSSLGFEVNPCTQFIVANEDGMFVIESGTKTLVVGDQEYPLGSQTYQQ